MTVERILDGVLTREGGWRDQVRRPDGSIDPMTHRGITAPVLGMWRRLGRQATRDELRAMGDVEARAIYRRQYVEGPGFTAEALPYEPLRAQLIDFGVNSDPARAVRWLQRVLGVTADGVFGPRTYAAVRRICELGYGPILNDALVAARSYMIDQAVDAGTMRKADEEGVESRALSFFVSRPGFAEPVSSHERRA